MNRRGAAVVAVFAALSAGLVGCVGTGPVAAVPPSSVTEPAREPTQPAPTSDPTAAPAADRVHITAETVSVLDSTGTELVSFGYRDLTADVVAGLTTHLGEPALERFPSGNHNGEGSRYVWDSLAVTSEDRWADASPENLPTYEARWWISATDSSARSFVVDTVDGVRVGDSTRGVIEAHPGADERLDMSGASPRTDIYLGAVRPPIPEDDPSFSTGQLWRVWLIDEDPTDTVEELRAPSANFGA